MVYYSFSKGLHCIYSRPQRIRHISISFFNPDSRTCFCKETELCKNAFLTHEGLSCLGHGIFVKNCFRTTMLTVTAAHALPELWRTSQCPSPELTQMSLLLGRYLGVWVDYDYFQVD